jgi:tetratricopeptide (TPR) repeat protein
MKKFCITLVMIVSLGSSVFAQQRRASRQEQSQSTVASQSATSFPIGADSKIVLPTRNDSIGIILRRRFNAAQDILDSPFAQNRGLSSFGGFNEVSKETRLITWQQALDTMETLARFLEPPIVSKDSLDTQSEDIPLPASDFVPDRLVQTYHFMGKGIIYNNMVMSRMFDKDSAAIFAQLAVDNFEGFIQYGVGPTSIVYDAIINIYLNFLNDSQKTLMYINASLAVDPNQDFLYVRKAHVLRDMGRINEACDAMKRALSRNPHLIPDSMRLPNCP